MEFIHLTAVLFMVFIAAAMNTSDFASAVFFKVLPALLAVAMFFDVLAQWGVI